MNDEDRCLSPSIGTTHIEGIYKSVPGDNKKPDSKMVEMRMNTIGNRSYIKDISNTIN